MSVENKKIPKVGDEYEIPIEGSLGLLALGYRGVKAWRKVKNKAEESEKNNKQEVGK